MTQQMYFCLLIVCGFLCEGIVQVLSENIVRRKRVISEVPGEDVPLKSGVAPYVAAIKSSPGNLNICVGSILSKRTVITDAACVYHYDLASLKIFVGSPYAHRGRSYNVVEKKIHPDEHPLGTTGGIGLLIVHQSIIFNNVTSPIALHAGALFAGTPATIFGWGCNFGPEPGTRHRYGLRSIAVRIMHHQECVDTYRNRAAISHNHICTYDVRRRCGHTDTGAPLVVNKELAAIYIWTGTTPRHINPDVYLIVQSVESSLWIRNNTFH